MPSGPVKLLIVGSDHNLNETIQDILSPYFDEISIAEDGESGFQRFRNHKPDLIISELHLPVLTGIDLVRKISKIESSARILLFSDTKDSAALITAIEYGIKGFLLKPINIDQLVQVAVNQKDKIIKERESESTEKRVLFAEQQYDKSKRILQTISRATASFFHSGFNNKSIHEVLRLIGEATESSRVYIYQNYLKDDEEYASRVYEWVDNDIMPAIGNLPVTDKKISSSGFERWVQVMKTHRGFVTGNIRDFELSEQKRLREHGIKSLLAIPIFANDLWWGFLGLDDCRKERIWTEPEIAALEALTMNLGAAIHKRNLDQQMIHLNKSLEKRVKERTRELEFEVAERAMAEALLKDSEEKYRLIYENATDGILLIQRGRIVLVNPAIVEILEDLPRNLIGKKFSELVAKENRKEVTRQFKKKAGEPLTDLFHVKVELVSKKTKWLELKPTRVTWYGETAQLVFVSNITAQKNAQDELYMLNDTLEKKIEEEVRRVELQQQLLVQKSKLESIGELSAGLAHEINQPLVSISMGLDNMLWKLKEDGINSQYLQTKAQLLFKDIERIKNIIEHVRTFSRDQQKDVLDEIIVSEVLMDALSLVQKQLAESNIKLEIGCVGGDLKVLGNQYRLEQVFLNMISNARHAVEERSKKTDSESYKKIITISCKQLNGFALIEITDNGIGIPAEILPNIFDPFFTTKSEEKGTGLGLSISYGIIKEMNGNVSADSVENEFTRINIELPIIT
jgi:PAS domain S-box-containing protein